MSVVTGVGPMRGHVIVCGLDSLGMRIVQQLHGFGEPVSVLLSGHDPNLEGVLDSWGVPHQTRGAVSGEALKQAGIATASAVVCADSSDVTNLETALLARDLRPDIRVVVRLANAVVRDALAADTGPGAVFVVADLAAPAVVENCLRRSAHRIEVDGLDLVSVTEQVRLGGTLRTLYGDLGPLAVVHGPNPYAGDAVPCPPHDTEVAAGDWAAVIGWADEVQAHGFPVGERSPDRAGEGFARVLMPGRKRRNLFVRMRVAAVELLHDIDRNFFRALAAMAVLVLVSVIVLRYNYSLPGMSYLDSLYFSAETIATVGYGDSSFLGQPNWLRAFSIFLMVAGVTITAILVAYIADLLVSRRLTQSAGRRTARTMSGHMILVGLGDFGIRVAAELVDAGQSVVAIERDPDARNLAVAAELGVPVVFGDASRQDVLVAAGLDRAAAVAILTPNEMVNIEVGLVVRQMLGDRWASSRDGDGVPVVLRVFDLPLGRVVAQRFGFRNVRSTVELAVPWFIAAALGLRVLGAFSVWQESYLMGAVLIDPDGGLAGKRLSEISPATRVVAINHAAQGHGLERNPHHDSRFDAGDIAYIVGPYAELIAMLRMGHPVR